MNTSTQKILPNLWFDNQAEQAAEFYSSIFQNSSIHKITRYLETGKEVHGKAPGSTMTVEFTLEGYRFIALNGGPQFTFNPSISFMVNCPTQDEVDALWQKLSYGGTALMPLDAYPFSQRYGWIQDKYGVTWQLIYSENTTRRTIVPSLMFVGSNCGKAEEAARLYASIFDDSKVYNIQYYPAQSDPQREGTVMFGNFELQNQVFAIMDSAMDHNFAFNEAISLVVQCESQKEVDHLWDSLTAVPEAEQCGWLKDKYGVSWQIVPTALNQLLSDPNTGKTERVMSALLQMKKIDLSKLYAVYK